MNFGAQPHKLDASGRSSLYIFLSCHDNVEAFKILFETHCTVLIREKCHQNEYLLYSAAKFNRYNIVRYLMERHADLIDLSLQHGPNNESPLHAVVRNSNEELLTFFLSQRNVGVDYLDSFNRSPFMLSCKLGFFGVTKLLYDKGAQLDLCDHDGDTGLHYAASRNWSPIIELLICNGADVNARNKRGLSPYNVASYETTKSLIQYLTAKQLSFAFKRVRVIEDENSFLKSQLLSMLERIEKLERQQTPQQ
ncbi:hypothetical protein C9374_008238 [Naegleria lovaniensis]|uniref:Ankyrin repeat protein n=1 Tax=Naegleria lovaniensis TaxID=51637 RepID=A0AA88KL84_NAELO|nr:uncharacterized protein C9374_008238 [Naegleria lovaniensis]KAG2378599.1 hypothetical protein C9374_008238 [Naegleria lovaniensis]